MIIRIFFALILAFSSFSAAAKSLKIVTDLSPVTLIVSEISVPENKIDQLIKSHVSPHDFALRPSNIVSLENADLIVWMGPVASPVLAKIMARKELAAKAVRLEDFLALEPQKTRSPGVFKDGADRGDHPDPHLWLYPANAIHWSEAIAGRLAQLDPENAEIYMGQSRELIDRISKSVAHIKNSMVQTPPLPFIYYHDAFQYFEIAFDLHAVGAVTSGEDESPSLGTIASLYAALEDYPKSCVFLENERQTKNVAQLKKNGRVHVGFVDPLGIYMASVIKSYPELLENIANSFISCASQVSE